MSNNLNVESWDVPALKTFLSRKGIACSIYVKRHLIKLCKLAIEIDLEDIQVPDDYEVMDTKRRTVGDQCFPCITSVVRWSDDLTHLPDIEISDVFINLLNNGWNHSRLKAYKQDNGYLLFTNNHIYIVKLSILSDSFVYIKCDTTPETRQSADPYKTWILVEKNGQIHSGGCTCVVDDGSCKHCTALMFALSSFCERHKDRHTQVGTYLPCTWDKPRRSSRPAEIQDLKVHIGNDCVHGAVPHHKVFNPCKTLDANANREIEKKLYDMCSGLGALLLQTLDPPSDAEEDFNCDDLPDMISSVKKANRLGESVTDRLRSDFSASIIGHIAAITNGQADCDEWYQHRRGRITASVFSKVFNFRDSKSHENYIVKEILKLRNDISYIPAIKFGRENENVARQLYFDQYKTCHRKAVVKTTGLHIYEDKPFMAASPDGLVSCKCCGNGLIEIKCSYSHKDETPEEVACDPNYHLYIEDNSVHLRQDPPWYTLIQGQLGIVKYKWCDFVFYTKRGLFTERIYFDVLKFNEIIKKCEHFFEEYLQSAIISS